jgi:FMN-dependent NADH-azoreductase
MTSVAHPTLLRIDASSRIEGSVSRRLADAAQAQWKRNFAHGSIRHRDLTASPIDHIRESTIEGFYTPPEQLTEELRGATALSDHLIEELETCHTVLISSPMYNFGVPSTLKAWIDQVVRIGRTFTYSGGRFEGLITRPRAVLALAYGAAGYRGPLAGMDHLRPYLTSILNFIGIAQVEVIAAEATTGDAGTVAAQIRAAERSARNLFSEP